RRVPRVIDVVSSGGTIKRYEVHPDPDRLKKYGITLQQLQSAIAASNDNVGSDYLSQGHAVLNVRGIGLIGGGLDPVQQVLGMEIKAAEQLCGVTRRAPVGKRRLAGIRSGATAAAHLRSEEERRLREIRQIVIASVNNVPIRVEDVVDGGRLSSAQDEAGRRGVVV